jgi:hypothetical protein
MFQHVFRVSQSSRTWWIIWQPQSEWIRSSFGSGTWSDRRIRSSIRCRKSFHNFEPRRNMTNGNWKSKSSIKYFYFLSFPIRFPFYLLQTTIFWFFSWILLIIFLLNYWKKSLDYFFIWISGCLYYLVSEKRKYFRD